MLEEEQTTSIPKAQCHLLVSPVTSTQHFDITPFVRQPWDRKEVGCWLQGMDLFDPLILTQPCQGLFRDGQSEHMESD